MQRVHVCVYSRGPGRYAGGSVFHSGKQTTETRRASLSSETSRTSGTRGQIQAVYLETHTANLFSITKLTHLYSSLLKHATWSRACNFYLFLFFFLENSSHRAAYIDVLTSIVELFFLSLNFYITLERKMKQNKKSQKISFSLKNTMKRGWGWGWGRLSRKVLYISLWSKNHVRHRF